MRRFVKIIILLFKSVKRGKGLSGYFLGKCMKGLSPYPRANVQAGCATVYCVYFNNVSFFVCLTFTAFDCHSRVRLLLIWTARTLPSC